MIILFKFYSNIMIFGDRRLYIIILLDLLKDVYCLTIVWHIIFYEAQLIKKKSLIVKNGMLWVNSRNDNEGCGL